MTIAAAESFIQKTISDPALVQRINAAPDKAAIKEIFSELKLDFDTEDFQKAYFNLLTYCQTEAQAEAVKEIKLWWDCLTYTLETSPEK